MKKFNTIGLLVSEILNVQISKYSMRVKFWNKTFKNFVYKFQDMYIISSMDFMINKHQLLVYADNVNKLG